MANIAHNADQRGRSFRALLIGACACAVATRIAAAANIFNSAAWFDGAHRLSFALAFLLVSIYAVYVVIDSLVREFGPRKPQPNVMEPEARSSVRNRHAPAPMRSGLPTCCCPLHRKMGARCECGQAALLEHRAA